MRALFTLLLLITGIWSHAQTGNRSTGIGTLAPDSTAILDIKSNTRGLLIPRMDSSAIAALPHPANGLTVYDTVKSVLYVYNATLAGWQRIRPVESLSSLVAGTAAGDVLVWNGSAWVVTPKCNLFSYYYRDRDGDGFGDLYFPVMGCTAPAGFVNNSTDCSDTSVAMHPGAAEMCNSKDDNCNGIADEGFNLMTDVSNCGSCSNVCNLSHATAGCSGGQCMIVSCASGWANCDGIASNGCEVNLSSATSCGSCTNICAAVPNATTACNNGQCVIVSCNAGFANCDGVYANGCEINLNSNLSNCGSCSNVVPVIPNTVMGCSGGQIVVLSCANGWANCDGIPSNGCEINILGNSTSNCGGCGLAAQTVPNAVTGCSGGQSVIISCASGYANCDGVFANGCEINLMTSPTNCNSCSNVCTLPNAVAGCAGGACTVSSCTPGYFDVDGIAGNGCELQGPVLLNTFQMPNSVTDISVAGNYAYAVSNSTNTLYMYDISNPTSIVLKSSITTNINNPQSVFVNGIYVYVVNAAGNTLAIYDVSGITTITAKGTIGTGISGPKGVFASGNYAYVINQATNALTIYDVSVPLSIVYKGSITTGISTPTDVYVSGVTAFVTSGLNNKLLSFDVTTPTAPVFLDSISTNLSTPWALVTQGNYAYVSSKANNRLCIFDISAPGNLIAKGSTSANITTPVGVGVAGSVAYVCGTGPGYLTTLNVSNVNAIASRSNTTTGMTPITMVTAVGKAYVLDANSNLKIFSLP